MEMLAFTQNIETPRASFIKGSKKSGTEDLVKILSKKKRQSTNLEMKKQLQVIIDYLNLSTYTSVSDAASGWAGWAFS